MSLVVRLHQLNCLLTWGVLTGVKSLLGAHLDGEQQMKLDMAIMSAYIQFESPDIIPHEIMQRIAVNYLVQGGIIFSVVLSLALLKAKGG